MVKVDGNISISICHTQWADREVGITMFPEKLTLGISENDRSSVTDITLSARQKYLVLHPHEIVMEAAFCCSSRRELWQFGLDSTGIQVPLAHPIYLSGLTGVGFVLGCCTSMKSTPSINYSASSSWPVLVSRASSTGNHRIFLHHHHRSTSLSHIWIRRLMMIGGR